VSQVCAVAFCDKAGIMSLHITQTDTLIPLCSDHFASYPDRGSGRAPPALKSGKKPVLPVDKKSRKDTPIATGVLDYFPLAIAELARVSKAGNDQHNPGQPLHWDRSKSQDHADCIIRHLIDRGTVDEDGMRHSAKVAWRALALLQVELEGEQK
jgi:hypothetical protein